MIEIGTPHIVTEGDFAKLVNTITIDGKQQELWFKVEKKYADYLCDDRGDAYLVAVLYYAMANHHNIQIDIPVTDCLLYKIESYLIPALIENRANYYRPQISADITSEPLPNAGAVATGISCGIDSLHAVSRMSHSRYSKLNITHLTFNNVGSHGEGEHARKLYQSRMNRPKAFAKEYGYEFVASDSNLMDVIKQNHALTHTYSSMFAVLCLQKLYSTYYYASNDCKFHEFSLTKDAGSYEILSLPAFSTQQLTIYSEGAGMSRLEKMREVINYTPSYKYLNVCLDEGDNCSRCEKCVRTMLGLDALGALDKYTEVFDVKYYRTHKRWYVQQMLYRIKDKRHDYFELYPYFKQDVTIGMRIKASVYPIINSIIIRVQRNQKLYKFLKRCIKR